MSRRQVNGKGVGRGGGRGAARGRGRATGQGAAGPPAAPSDLGECYLCHVTMTLEDSAFVWSGLPRLIESSRIRGREDHAEFFEGRQEAGLRLHRECRRDYTNPRRTEPLSRSQKLERRCASDQGTQLRSAPDFTFIPTEQCLFCGAEIDFAKYQKLSHAERRSVGKRVHRVETFAMQTKVKTAIKTRREHLGELDAWALQVESRVAGMARDFCAAEVRYHAICDLFFSTNRDIGDMANPRGRPVGSGADVDRMFANLCEFLDTSEECQFSIAELENHVIANGDQPCSRKWLKIKLLWKYGDHIKITESPGIDNVLNFSGFVDDLIRGQWYADRQKNPSDESKRIVILAAQLAAEEVRKWYRNTDEYPSLDNLAGAVPPLLRLFLETLITTKAEDKTSVQRKHQFIGESVLLAMRPKSYISPLLLCLGTALHREFGSRDLVDTLSSLGASHSYHEVKRFVFSLTAEAKRRSEETPERQDGFLQWAFDNLDWLTATLDGKGTLHRMGGAQIVTPARILPAVNVKRLELPSTAEAIAARGHFIPLEIYNKPVVNGLSRRTVRPLTLASAAATAAMEEARVLDTLYLAGLWAGLPSTPSWSGFMRKAMKCDGVNSYHCSSVDPTPLVDNDPTDCATIYSVLLFAAKECRRRGQVGCFVTFDNGLYPKAAEIVASDESGDLARVVPRLGGFHLLMSFLGAIGFIMAGSGLDAVWATIYAVNSVFWMMAGKAFARAVRAHFLTQEAVGVMLLRSDPELDDNDKEELCRLHTDFLNNRISAADAASMEVARQLWTSLQAAGERAAARSRTGRLWWQYYRLVGLMRLYYRAERTGNWTMHLATTTAMEPTFAAAHHHNYTKSTRLYIQTMEDLDGDLAEAAEKGYFTVRRSSAHWAGVWTDMVVEQDVMRCFKSQGGMTRGRGLTDSVLSQWIGAMPALNRVTAALEEFCGVQRIGSEQHTDLRESRMKRDNEDRAAVLSYLEAHNPFGISDGIHSISTGVVGSTNVNCDQAEEAGARALASIVGLPFENLKISQKARVVPLQEPAVGKRKHAADVTSETSALFVSMCCAGVSAAQFREFVKYELCREPPALFLNGMMRHTAKSALTKCLRVPPSQNVRQFEREVTVVDGGYLLHLVGWPRPGKRGARRATWGDVCRGYVKYIERHYHSHGPIKVVFDGYGAGCWSTKWEEQRRRATIAGDKMSPDIAIREDLPVCDVQREPFLANVRNKAAFIEMLAERLREAGVEVFKANADADGLIVKTALAQAAPQCHVRVVATDTDILTMLIARVRDEHVTVIHPATKTAPEETWDIASIRAALGGMTECVLAVHALSGCDTTAAIYKKGKIQLWALVKEDPDLQAAARVFNEPDADVDKLVASGEKLMLALYNKSTTARTLDELRHYTFSEMAADPKKRQKLFSTNLALMPFTSNACRMKSLRSYLQVQQWLGEELSPTDFGWLGKDMSLVPIPTTLPFAPEDLLQAVSCGCKTGCKENSNCSCRKNKTACSAACRNCRGNEALGCTNTLEGGEVLDDFT